MTPGDTLPPPSRPVEPPFPVGDVREVVHRLRGGFYNAFHGPPPDGGASRRRDGVVVVLVVTDPLRGAGRTHPLRGRAVTVSDSCANLVQTRSVAGCQLLNQSMDSGCQSRFREIHQKSNSAILHRFLRDDRRRREKDVRSVRSSGVRCADVLAGANRGAVRVIGNLLVSGRALCMSVGECE